MSVQPISVSLNHNNYNNNNKKQVAFKGLDSVIVPVMDAMDRGGFAASFVAQDMGGMALPRIAKGFYRNSDETGKPNYAFATKEAIREILSGPSTFIIPALLFAGTKKFAGKANGVEVDNIKAFGDEFKSFSANQSKDTLAQTLKDGSAKKSFYKQAFQNLVESSLEGKVAKDEAGKLAEGYAQKLIEIEKAPSKGFFKQLVGKAVAGSKEDLTSSLIEDLSNLKKSHLGPDTSVLSGTFNTAKGKMGIGFKKFFTNLKLYTEDATASMAKSIKKGTFENANKFVENFNMKRVASRVLSNGLIYGATVAFMIMIPKLYKSKNGNPGLAGLESAQGQSQQTAKTEDSKAGKEVA